MKHVTSTIIAIAVVFSVASYSFFSLYEDWQDPYYLTDALAGNLTGYLSEEGIFYPPNDLDDPLLEHRKIIINSAINERTAKEVVRKLIYLDSVDPDLPIDFYVTTNGGWIDSAFAIVDTMNSISAPVNTLCVGGCYSAGAIIIAAGTGQRTAYSNSVFSIHLYYGDTLLESDVEYGQEPERVNGYLSGNTNLPGEWFPLEDDRHYYLTAKEALAFGLVDDINERKNDIAKDGGQDNVSAAGGQ